MVYVLSAIAAVIIGIGTVIQQRSAFQAPPEYGLSPKLLLWLVQRPLWLGGVAASLVGNIVFAVAVGTGSVALVEAMFVLRLIVALVLAAWWGRHRIPGRDWLGVLAIIAGLAAFVLSARPHKGMASIPDTRWAIVGGIIVLLGLIVMVVAKRLGPARKAALLGAAAGAMFGLQAALTNVAIHVMSHGGVLDLATTWSGYSVAFLALFGTLLVQSAYEAAPLSASYPSDVNTELLAGIAIGVWVLGGSIRLGLPYGAIAAIGIVIMIVGIYLLTTSKLVTGEVDELVRKQEVGHARRNEQHLERELHAIEKHMARAHGRSSATPMHRWVAARDFRRIDESIDRLCALQEDIHRHRADERERLPTVEEPERREMLEHDRDLSEQEHRIDEHATRLRERAEELAARFGGDIDRSRRLDAGSSSDNGNRG